MSRRPSRVRIPSWGGVFLFFFLFFFSSRGRILWVISVSRMQRMCMTCCFYGSLIRWFMVMLLWAPCWFETLVQSCVSVSIEKHPLRDFSVQTSDRLHQILPHNSFTHTRHFIMAVFAWWIESRWAGEFSGSRWTSVSLCFVFLQTVAGVGNVCVGSFGDISNHFELVLWSLLMTWWWLVFEYQFITCFSHDCHRSLKLTGGT